MNKITIGIIVAVIAAGTIGVIASSGKKDSMADTMPMQARATSAATNSSDQTVKTGKVSLDIKDFDYSVRKLRIKAGTTVTWTNQDSAHHDVMPDQESPDFPGSGKLLAKGESYSYTFQKAGSYSYHCTPHPYMKATVEVVE